MYLPRYLTTLFLCAAGKRNHNLTKIPTRPLHTYCQVAVNCHIQMPASTGKQLNPYAWKQYTPLWSYHSSPKNMAPYSNSRGYSKCIVKAKSEKAESKKPLLDDYKKKKLFKAIENNNIEEVKMFLDTYKDVVNARDKDGMTPFLCAAKEGSPEILGLLKKNEANVSATDEYDNNALHYACKMGRIETARWLLNNCNMNLEATESFERTPFLDAVREGHLEILKLLEEKRVNVSATDEYDNNALHLACMMGKTETVRWLLKKCKVNLEAKDKWYKMTPFLHAAENGHLDILKLLKAYKADVNVEDEYGNNALHFACCYYLGSVEMAIWLLDVCKINKETKGRYQQTPFLFAAKEGHLGIAKRLKERGADINAKNELGNNALHFACYYSGSVAMVEWLLDECKVSIESKGSAQKTPFLCATEKGEIGIAKLLRERGANIHAKDEYGYNALYLACRNSGSVEMITWLLDECKIDIETKGSAQKTPFIYAAKNGQMKLAKQLKERGANIHAKDKDGDNALHFACLCPGSVEMVTWLLDECKIGIETKGFNQKTPFLCATEKGQLKIAKLLKKRGADINAKNELGNNALHFACLCAGSVEMVTWLLDECKIGIETKGFNQKTPFLCAAQNGQLAIAKLLKKRGADINAKNELGNNALHFACYYSGSVAMVEWLLDECKIDIESKENYQKTPFLWAAQNGQLGIAKLLKERGANIYATDKYGNNALNLADSKNIKMITWLSDECKLKKVTWLQWLVS